MFVTFKTQLCLCPSGPEGRSAQRGRERRHRAVSGRCAKPPANISACVLLHRELKVGIPVTDEEGTRLGESAHAARQAIAQVVVSRVLMAVPGMGE